VNFEQDWVYSHEKHCYVRKAKKKNKKRRKR